MTDPQIRDQQIKGMKSDLIGGDLCSMVTVQEAYFEILLERVTKETFFLVYNKLIKKKIQFVYLKKKLFKEGYAVFFVVFFKYFENSENVMTS